MTVDSALNLWPQLESTGQTLGSPAVAGGGADGGRLAGPVHVRCGGQGLPGRLHHAALVRRRLHTTNAVNQLRTYLQAVYDRYHKPIWLTEFALIKFTSGGSTCTRRRTQQAAFVTGSAQMLASLSFVQRYAWFALPASDTGDRTGLFRSGPAVTDGGQGVRGRPAERAPRPTGRYLPLRLVLGPS